MNDKLTQQMDTRLRAQLAMTVLGTVDRGRTLPAPTRQSTSLQTIQGLDSPTDPSWKLLGRSKWRAGSILSPVSRNFPLSAR